MSENARPSADVAGGEGPGAEIPTSAAYRVTLPEFEGPLDLLLHLCKTHEIDILNIPIAFVTQKYLAYLDVMEAMSVEIAAEYLVMAATLAYLKARELVPNPDPIEAQGEEGEEAGDPKEELIRRLLEYQKYKDAAEKLGGRPIEGRNVFPRGVKLEGAAIGHELAEHSPWKLIECFAHLLKQAAPKVTHDVVIDRMSLSDRINQIIDKLETGGGTFRFDTLVDFSLGEVEVRHQLVVTLLAILELAKSRVIRVLQDPATEAFFISQREGASLAEARRARATSEHAASAAEEESAAAEAAVPEAAEATEGAEGVKAASDVVPDGEVAGADGATGAGAEPGAGDTLVTEDDRGEEPDGGA